jgi:hypothetical protein
MIYVISSIIGFIFGWMAYDVYNRDEHDEDDY